MLMYEEQEKTAEEDYRLMISQISHEIRNPLTCVNSSIQSIQKMHPEVESFEFWGQIKNDLQYMKVLLDGGCTFNNREPLKYAPIDPRAFAFDLKDTLLPELLRRHIPLLIKLDDTYPDFYGDPIRLKQVFINLLKNAMESISGRGRITLKVFAYEKRLLIAVRDNGCGLTPEQQQTIFQPFVSHKESGAGLGLSISQKIVQAHGGSIHVRSSLGKGSEFQVYLPLGDSPPGS